MKPFAFVLTGALLLTALLGCGGAETQDASQAPPAGAAVMNDPNAPTVAKTQAAEQQDVAQRQQQMMQQQAKKAGSP